MSGRDGPRIPRATYRIQFNRHFTFDGYDYALVDVHDGRPFVVHLTWRYVADAFEVKAQEATRLMQEALSGFAFVP